MTDVPPSPQDPNQNPAGQPPPGTPAPPPPPGGQQPQMVQANPFDAESTPILVTGILSLILCGPLGIYAWIKGNSLRDRAQAAGYPEPSSAKIGRILGIIAVVIMILAILLFVALAVVGALASSSNSYN